MKMGAYYDQYDYRAFWKGRDYEWQADKMALERLLDKVIAHRERLIDVGCGFGRNAPSYASKWKRAVLFDPSKKILEEAKENAIVYRNIEFVQGTAEKLPFTKRSFDTIVCIRVFHHIAQPEKVIKEFGRVIKNGGFLILEVANKRHLKAVITALLHGVGKNIFDHSSIDRGTKTGSAGQRIAFVNHHPESIMGLLKREGFVIKDVLSVSNFRNLPFLNFIPLSFLLWKERWIQPILAKLWFGPSIYFLARKT